MWCKCSCLFASKRAPEDSISNVGSDRRTPTSADVTMREIVKNRLSTRPVVILRRCSGREIAERTLLVGLGSTSFRSARFSAGDEERDLAPAASGKSESANCSLEGLAAHPMSGKQIHKPRRGGAPALSRLHPQRTNV